MTDLQTPIVPSFDDAEDTGRKLAIICSKGNLDMAYPGLILANNLYGTEIDPRAGALAAFALSMKARTSAGSLRPGANSRPEDATTPRSCARASSRSVRSGPLRHR